MEMIQCCLPVAWWKSPKSRIRHKTIGIYDGFDSLLKNPVCFFYRKRDSRWNETSEHTHTHRMSKWGKPEQQTHITKISGFIYVAICIAIVPYWYGRIRRAAKNDNNSFTMFCRNIGICSHDVAVGMLYSRLKLFCYYIFYDALFICLVCFHFGY